MIVHMIGNAHLQPAGMWTLNAGKDEVLATLRAAVDRCEEFPLYRFSFGEVWAYQLVEKLDPKLFKRIKKLVRKKQWSVSHGMFTLTNPETTSSEIWKQNVSIGNHYCIHQLGATPQFAVNFEASSLPESYLNQLIEAGYKGVVFGCDGAVFDEVKSPIFRWQNTNGDELLCYCITPGYRTRASELYGQIIESVESGNLAFGHTLCFYGIGDHGGGPNKENIEYIIENKDAFEGSELKFSTLEEFFSDALLMSDSFPVYRGTIGNIRPGQYLTGHLQRMGRNRAETALVQASRLHQDFGTKRFSRDLEGAVEDAWKDLLFASTACFSNMTLTSNHLHSLHGLLSKVRSVGEDWSYTTSRVWSREKLEDFNYQQIVVLNPSKFEQEAWVEFEPNLDFDEWRHRCLCDENGDIIPVQHLTPEAPQELLTRILFQTKVDPLGYRVFHLREFSSLEEKPVSDPSNEDSFRVLKTTLENSRLVLRYSTRALTRISFKGKEDNLLGRLGMSFSSYEDTNDLFAQGVAFSQLPFSSAIESEGWSVLEQGPLKVSMVNRGTIGASRFEWVMSLSKDDERIYNKFRVFFADTEKLLQLNLQLDEEVSKWYDATSSVPMDRVSSDQEHPFHGWTTAVSQSGSFSVVSRDIFSFSHQENTLRFSLLRSPKEGNTPTASAEFLKNRTFDFTDQGMQEFEFVVIPRSEKYDLDQELEALQFTPIVIDRYENVNRPAWGNSTPARLQETNELRAKKDGRMTHLT